MKKIIYILIAFTTFSCSKPEEVKETAAEKPSNSLTLTEVQLKNLDIQSTFISNQNMPTVLKLTAKTDVSPQNTVSITSAFGGYIKRLALIPGNAVVKGQVVVVLEDPQYIQMQEDYLTTKALLEQATADYKRQRDLNVEQAASNKVMQQAKATQQTLLVKKSALEQRLRLMNINPSSVNLNNISRTISVASPVNGTVTKVLANTGQYVSPADAILEIINTTSGLLNIKVFQKDISSLQIGQTLKAYTNNNPDKKMDATITSISSQVNPDGTSDVFAKISSTNGLKFTENMYFNVELTVKANNANVLPESAVVEFEGRNYSFEQIGATKFKLIPVQVGASGNGFIEIISPQLEAKKIVSHGAYQLLTALKNSGEE